MDAAISGNFMMMRSLKNRRERCLKLILDAAAQKSRGRKGEVLYRFVPDCTVLKWLAE
jgi:hypothetical protein